MAKPEWVSQRLDEAYATGAAEAAAAAHGTVLWREPLAFRNTSQTAIPLRKRTMTDTNEHLHDLIKDFRYAMLTTRTADGGVHIRPMAVAKVAANEELFFATGLSSPKIDEIANNASVAVSFQSNNEFAALYGTARVLKDRALIEQLWSEAWRIWFPGGKDDPNLCLLTVTPSSAEYWDTSGAEGFKYLYEGLKAVLQKRTPDLDVAQHAKVSL
jgi:general stress protein 26